MSFTKLSTENTQIIYSYTALQDALRLARTSKASYQIFLGHRLPILRQAICNTYTPIPELLKLVLSRYLAEFRWGNPHARQNGIVNMLLQVDDYTSIMWDFNLIKKIAEFGKAAERWAHLYPRLRWRFNPSNRRPLREDEKENLRRAIYICWIFGNVFHEGDGTETVYSLVDGDPRIRLLPHWSAEHLSQVSDLIFHIEVLFLRNLLPWEHVTPIAWMGMRFIGAVESHVEEDQALNPEEIPELMEIGHMARIKSIKLSVFSGIVATNFMESPGSLNDCLGRCMLMRKYKDGLLSFPSLVTGSRREEDIEAWSDGREGLIAGSKKNEKVSTLRGYGSKESGSGNET